MKTALMDLYASVCSVIRPQLTRLWPSFANPRGQGLIQILISIGMLGIFVMVFASIMLAQTNEIKALTQKLASADLEKLLQTSLANGSVCQYIMNTPTQLRLIQL